MSEPIQITEGDVARNLMFARYRRSFVLPRYTPRQWWEADVFELTPSGYFREYEIKLTLADFRADAEKRKEDRWRRAGASEETKHQRLARGDPAGPTQFWFVAPAGVIPLDQVPDWAGLIEMQICIPTGYLMRMRERQVVKAPRLHRTPADPRIEVHARSVIYYRLHTLMSEMEGLPPLPSNEDEDTPVPAEERR